MDGSASQRRTTHRGQAVKELIQGVAKRPSSPGGSFNPNEPLLPESSAGGGEGSAWWNPKKDLTSSFHMAKSSLLNLLILACPLGIASEYLGWGAQATFMLNLCGLIPLALLLGEVTEDLALRLGDVLGGLLNATFGNVVEIILSIAALQKNLYEVVASSLLGSILSNLLLVLGMCFFFGGTKYKIQKFNPMASSANSSLLTLSSISIILPTAALHLGMGGAEPAGLEEGKVLLMSRLTAVALLIIYAAYLYFQLGSHADMFVGSSGEEEEGEDQQGPMLTLTAAIIWLFGITVLVAISSEFLTGSIEEVSHAWGLSQSFLGFIVLPIAGNACEHITAVFVAYKNKMDLSIGVAIGSSLQIGLFAVPFITVVGWMTGHPFTLAFDPFAALVLILSVLHANVVMQDAESHWLEGLQLLVTYFIIAAAYAMTSS